MSSANIDPRNVRNAHRVDGLLISQLEKGCVHVDGALILRLDLPAYSVLSSLGTDTISLQRAFPVLFGEGGFVPRVGHRRQNLYKTLGVSSSRNEQRGILKSL